MRKLRIQAHCSDSFNATLRTDNGTTEYDGYVLPFLGRGGDNVELTIDIDTGQILNWRVPKDEELTGEGWNAE